MKGWPGCPDCRGRGRVRGKPCLRQLLLNYALRRMQTDPEPGVGLGRGATGGNETESRRSDVTPIDAAIVAQAAGRSKPDPRFEVPPPRAEFLIANAVLLKSTVPWGE